MASEVCRKDETGALVKHSRAGWRKAASVVVRNVKQGGICFPCRGEKLLKEGKMVLDNHTENEL